MRRAAHFVEAIRLQIAAAAIVAWITAVVDNVCGRSGWPGGSRIDDGSVELGVALAILGVGTSLLVKYSGVNRHWVVHLMLLAIPTYLAYLVVGDLLDRSILSSPLSQIVAPLLGLFMLSASSCITTRSMCTGYAVRSLRILRRARRRPRLSR